MNPFDYLKSINETKDNLMVDEASERAYNAFIVNRGLSLFPDTIFLANEMNRYHRLDNRCQYDFLINSIRKRKRFAKWHKPEDNELLMIVKEYYGYNDTRAKEALSLMSRGDIDELRKRTHTGGKSARRDSSRLVSSSNAGDNSARTR